MNNFKLTKSKIFLFCCLALIVGVAIASFLPIQVLQNDIWWFAAMVAGAAAAILGWRVKIARIAALIALFLFLGIWRYGISLPTDAPDKIWHYNGEEAEVVGIVANEPDARDDKVKYTIKTKKLNLQKRGAIFVSGNILIAADLYPAYNYGDELEIRCRLAQPEKFNGFDYDRYLARHDIYSVCYRPEIRLLSTRQGNWFYENIFKLKDKLRAAINYGLPEPEASLAGPLIFGGQKGLPPDLREKFSQTGLTHIMAVSGMNVSMLAAIVSVLFLAVGFSRRQSFYLSGAFLIIYIILVGAPASAVRAGFMGFLIIWALHLGRLYKPANSLALAAAIMLFINPKILRDDVGFQLSFLAIIGMVYFYPILNKRLNKFFSLSKVALPAKIFSAAKDIFAVTLAAQVLTAPILIFNFSRISLVAPLANLAVLPALPILSIMIIAAIPPGLFAPAAATLFFFPSWLLLRYIILAVEWSAKIPYASVNIDYFPAALVVFYYAAASLFLFMPKNAISSGKTAGRRDCDF